MRGKRRSAEKTPFRDNYRTAELVDDRPVAAEDLAGIRESLPAGAEDGCAAAVLAVLRKHAARAGRAARDRPLDRGRLQRVKAAARELAGALENLGDSARERLEDAVAGDATCSGVAGSVATYLLVSSGVDGLRLLAAAADYTPPRGSDPTEGDALALALAEIWSAAGGNVGFSTLNRRRGPFVRFLQTCEGFLPAELRSGRGRLSGESRLRRVSGEFKRRRSS